MEDKSILNIDTRNKRLLIRADLNVPINNNKISDETRIERFCSGVSKLLKKNAKINSIFDPKTLKDLVNLHLNGKENRRLLIWSFLYLEEFLEQF